MNRWLTLGFLLALALAMALRLPRLDQRPLHTDESVHAYKFLGLWNGAGYKYDPHEYHGPSLYYATLPFVWLSGARSAASVRETTLRLVPLTFGVGLILLLPLLADGLGRGAIWWAALFTAVSPVFVFYSRYYIHELPLVFFTLLLMGATWRFVRTDQLRWAVLAGVALGLMQATKETFVFNLAAAAAGLALTFAWGHWREGALWWPETRLHRRHLLAGLGVAALISVVLFTSFFTNARGPLDSLLTYQPWFSRAGGESPHNHPWNWYWERLYWFRSAGNAPFTEAFLLALALLGFSVSLRRHLPRPGPEVRLVRFLGFYTLGLMAIYTVLPYKTPWCVLGFHSTTILLAGAGAMVILRAARARWQAAAAMGVMFAAVAHLAWQSWQLAVPLAADQRNPWVYSHTSANLLQLVNRVREIAAATDHPTETVIKVIGRRGDYWPLPWYLRDFKRVGFFPDLPEDPWAPIMIVTSKFDAELDVRSNKRWLMVGLFEQRPNVFFELYVQFDLWKKYLETRPPPAAEDE